MDGDAIYGGLTAGVFTEDGDDYPGPNRLPAELSLVDQGDLAAWMAFPTCEAARLSARQKVTRYLDAYDDETGQEEVLFTYCWGTTVGLEPGQWFRDYANDGSVPYFCQEDDPLAPNYFGPFLSDSEYDQWYVWMGPVSECGLPSYLEPPGPQSAPSLPADLEITTVGLAGGGAPESASKNISVAADDRR
jgi:hypothetical protein